MRRCFFRRTIEGAQDAGGLEGVLVGRHSLVIFEVAASVLGLNGVTCRRGVGSRTSEDGVVVIGCLFHSHSNL